MVAAQIPNSEVVIVRGRTLLLPGVARGVQPHRIGLPGRPFQVTPGTDAEPRARRRRHDCADESHHVCATFGGSGFAIDEAWMGTRAPELGLTASGAGREEIFAAASARMCRVIESFTLLESFDVYRDGEVV
jgi:hypothetical protein